MDYSTAGSIPCAADHTCFSLFVFLFFVCVFKVDYGVGEFRKSLTRGGFLDEQDPSEGPSDLALTFLIRAGLF